MNIHKATYECEVRLGERAKRPKKWLLDAGEVMGESVKEDAEAWKKETERKTEHE